MTSGDKGGKCGTCGVYHGGECGKNISRVFSGGHTLMDENFIERSPPIEERGGTGIAMNKGAKFMGEASEILTLKATSARKGHN